MKLSSVKTQLIIFLTGLAIYIIAQGRGEKLIVSLIVAVVTAAAVEALAVYLKTKKFALSESSLITGLIIGLVAASNQEWWLVPAAAALAIVSKHLIRFNNKHLFNPAAMGIFLMVIIWHGQTEWHGTYLWPALVPAGLYFAWRFVKIEVLAGYLVVALSLFAITALARHDRLEHIFGYLSYFYIAIMLIEPKTSPIKVPGKYWFGAGAAAVIFILTETGVRFDAELAGLLAMNIFTPLLNGIKAKGGK